MECAPRTAMYPDFDKQYGGSIYRLEKANQCTRMTFGLWSLEKSDPTFTTNC